MSIVRGLILMLNDNASTSVHYQIAQHVLLNLETIPSLTIEDAAEICYTSPATFSRFCKAMNCSGFNDFKTRLSTALQDYAYTTLDTISNTQLPLEHTISTTLNQYHLVLKQCETFLTHEKIMALMEDLNNVDTILFCGWTHMASLNRELLFDLVMHKKIFHAAFNPSLQLSHITDFSKTMVIFIQPCKWPGMEKNVQNVKIQGGKITLISNNPSSDLSSYVDHKFTFPSTHSTMDYLMIEMVISTISTYYRKLYTKKH